MSKKVLVILSILIISLGSILLYYSYGSKNREKHQESTNISITNQLAENKKLTNLSIEYLRSLNIDSEKPIIEEELSSGSNYKRYLASYKSEGNKIYGLLTIPNEDPPEGGFSAIIFNHGYLPPAQYVTTEKYIAHVDALARSGFVVFKIDMRGHGKSEGKAIGSYFSPGYTIDAISALKSLQKMPEVNANKIGMWGHSMAGNLVLRAMLTEPAIKAGVIWAGAVYSYEDFSKYRLNDSSYVRPQSDPHYDPGNLTSEYSEEVRILRDGKNLPDFNNDFWSSISLTNNLNYLNSSLQIHHARNDNVVNIGYSRDLAEECKKNEKELEFYEYGGGGHNIDSPYFEQAMERTIEFFKEKLE